MNTQMLLALGVGLGLDSTTGLALLALLATAGVAIVGMSWLTEEPFVKYLMTVGLAGTDGKLNLVDRVSAKTADYTIDPDDGDHSGTTFTTRGAAGAVIFTLPAPAARLAGFRYRFKNVVDQNMTVKTATADTLIALNDLAADSVAASTTSEKIGAEIEAFCDGTSWFASGVAVGHTYTIATA